MGFSELVHLASAGLDIALIVVICAYIAASIGHRKAMRKNEQKVDEQIEKLAELRKGLPSVEQ